MITTKNNVNGSIVWKEDYNTRWLDALGENVIKYISGPGLMLDGDPWTKTSTGTNTITGAVAAGGWKTITTGVTEYNGDNLQLENNAFKLESGKPVYFGIKFASQHATKGDFLFGLCETDTTLMATSSAHAASVTDDGVYFYHLNDATTVYFANELGGVVGTTATGETHDTDAHVYEIYYDGTLLHAYFDDVLLTSISSGIADQVLTPSLNVRAGDDGAEVYTIYWIRAIQCR